ncbi:TM2 domain-containing protein [Mycoplasma testudineum]|uniref:TM2 domain-containing protein n=1 Tax=Mycoplasma testudineum TaxID=244584 RepID=A0A4R6IES1_9MOLU|nr:NINE protein [Mycoplasma testudineum]OYD26935.1 hypothetical protein CG473_01180 [Mycoplasma testudineum]TDO20484.1 TM2 domain-containing protein [Mycoplasma testudineum]
MGQGKNVWQRTGKSKTVAILLSLFLGFLGIDRFYLGRAGTGVLKLFFGFLIWHIIDFVRILLGLLTPKE